MQSKPRSSLVLAGLLLSGQLLALTSGCGSPPPPPAGDGLEVISSSLDPTITWQRVGTPGQAVKIAACAEGDGRVYALNQDRTIWVSHDSGKDGSWKFVVSDTYVQQIFCGGNQLWVLNDD